MGHALTENRNSLIVGATATRASGHGERLAALHLIEPHPDRAPKVARDRTTRLAVHPDHGSVQIGAPAEAAAAGGMTPGVRSECTDGAKKSLKLAMFIPRQR
ncbi:MAG: hypothetical protein INF75_12625 [Roseomonas sp.]|nr:hypothetical protein [Roseomonas sp.]MCA3455807.1 hypothetical protein [Rhodobacter sp.]MCA3328536.1 hypothetical protein [Roseomonas sp.]MCA3330036.1 hypothetical protein [Roseomonas sp.]MCA3333698.1 hypothetical protein [Roseomonas sp.]